MSALFHSLIRSRPRLNRLAWWLDAGKPVQRPNNSCRLLTSHQPRRFYFVRLARQGALASYRITGEPKTVRIVAPINRLLTTSSMRETSTCGYLRVDQERERAGSIAKGLR